MVISGPLATAALLSGDVDFSGGGGSGMRAALKGAPVIPSAEGIKNFLEYDIKIPLGFKEDIPPERLLNCSWSKEVKEESEAAQRRTKKWPRNKNYANSSPPARASSPCRG